RCAATTQSDLPDDEPEYRLVSVDELAGESQLSHEHRDRLLGRVVVRHDLEQLPGRHVVEGHAGLERRPGADLSPEIEVTPALRDAHKGLPLVGSCCGLD